MAGYSTDVFEGADAPATTATTYELTIGDTAYGRIATAGDHDWIAVDLVAGQTYTFALVGTGSTNLLDPKLKLWGTDGVTLIRSDDDSLPNLNATFTYTATTTGTRWLDAYSAVGAGTGTYGLAASLGDKAAFDDRMITGVIDSHKTWAPARGQGVTVTYAFRGTDPNDADHAGFSRFTQTEIDETRFILSQIAEVSGLVFQEVNPGGYSDAATILLANYDMEDGSGGHAYYPGDTAAADVDGDVWINIDPATIDPASRFGNVRTIRHEIGHALGLSHPGDYNAAPGVDITYAGDAQFVQDSRQYTVMSYFDAPETGASDLPADSLMLHDIAALQAMYGANMTTRTGDTVYGFGSNAGDVHDFAVNTTPHLAIWDAGGSDTLDASRYAADQTIELTAGKYSDIGGYQKNVVVALGATLENAIGGLGDDSIQGNTAANVLTGGMGADVIYGDSGNDVLVGGGGFASARTDFDLVTTSAANGASTSVEPTNIFPTTSFTIEFLWDQTSTANAGFIATFGNVYLYRHADGAVSLRYDDAPDASNWYDRIIPASVTDGDLHRVSITYSDATGKTTVYLDGIEVGSETAPTGTRALSTGYGVDFTDNASVGDVRIYNRALTAAEVWDTTFITLANPAAIVGLIEYWKADAAGILVSQIAGQPSFTNSGAVGAAHGALLSADDDDLDGGSGIDTASYASATAAVRVALSTTARQDTGGAGRDSLRRIENLIGSAFDDQLTGGDGVNDIVGGLGNDIINGRAGADTMHGGSGNDRFYVDDGGDVADEAVGGGSDRIYARVAYTLAAGEEIEGLYADAGAVGLALTGNEFANVVYGNAGADSLDGGAGADRLAGRGGNDRMAGGLGDDTFYVSEGGDTVVEAIGDGAVDMVYAAVDWTAGAGQEIERIIADAGATGLSLGGNELVNRLNGGVGADVLSGGAGGDSLYGGDGADRVIGGAGRDTCYGNAGADTFVLMPTLADRDTIRDFDAADLLEISASLFGGGLTAGALDAAAFRANTTGLAGDVDDRLIYNTATGYLFWDADGTGSGAGVSIAVLATKPTLSAADFVIAA